MFRVLLIGVAVVGGCVSSEPGVRTPDVVDPRVAASEVRTPFAPRVIRIHPLTQIARDEQGEPVIALHIEMLDAWGDGVKGVGTLIVFVVGAGEGRRWDVDLLDLTTNAAAYDPATRTYRLQLGGLPDWLRVRDGRPAARLEVRFQTPDETGRVVELVDAYELR